MTVGTRDLDAEYRQACERERELRRERTELAAGSRVDEAGRKVRALVAEGLGDGDAKLEEARAEYRKLDARRAELPGLILGALLERVALRAEILGREVAELKDEAGPVREENARAQEALKEAQEAAERIWAELQGYTSRIDRLGFEQGRLQDFIHRVRGLPREKRLAVLEQVRAGDYAFIERV